MADKNIPEDGQITALRKLAQHLASMPSSEARRIAQLLMETADMIEAGWRFGTPAHEIMH